MDEKIVWNQIQKGNAKAFRIVFDKFYNELCTYMLQFTKNMNDAEEIVQLTFMNLWEKRASIQIQTSIKRYLFRSAYHVFIDNYRQEKRKKSLVEKLTYEALSEKIEEDLVVREEKLARIEQLVAALPQKCKEILLLSKKEGLKNKEIAAKLKISVKTVESQIRVAFIKIRESF